MEEELEALKQRKLLELQKKLMEEEERRKALEKYEQQKRAALRVILTPEARERLNNIRIVRPSLAESIELQLIQLYNMGRIRGQITDEQLKRILLSVQRQRKEIKVRFK